ncbi:BTAD domain-containing putative transcriptional regulator [Streptomyces sp. NPDC056656]|uniref:BTAD domain-containing putative transcriptional regulator n=1 Tax=Streptomyces sp. NPDC056656 TaxID=3345895 RepID=UPI00369A54C7
MHSAALRFGVLGPIEAWYDGTPVDLGPPKRRVLLARLLLDSGQPVSVERLCHDLWPADDRPAAAVPTVHSHISRLRTILEPERAARERSSLLVREPSGYLLRISPEALDATVFERLVTEADEALRQTHSEDAYDKATEALRLWRGPAFSEATDLGFAASEVNRLQSLRQTAEELRVSSLLEMGRGDSAVPLAETLTVTAPLREASWALLMKALYATGRGAEALQQYERFRRALAEELGVNPGPALRALHLAVVNEDSRTILPDRRPPQAAVAPAAAEEAEDVAPLLGRDDELRRIADIVKRAADGKGTHWTFVSGGLGAGKTRLLEQTAADAERQGFAPVRLRCCGPADDPLSNAVFGPAARLLAQLRAGASATPPTTYSGESALTDLLAELGGRATVLLVDDLDALCDACRQLVRHLSVLLRDQPVVVLCSTGERAAVGTASLTSSVARERTFRIGLQPLSVEDVAALLTAVGTARSAPVEHASALHRRSGGNPFVLNALLELPPQQRVGPEAVVPPALVSVVAARLDELPEAARVMVTQAAVCGPDLDVPLLVELLDISRGDLLKLVDNAVHADLVAWQPGSLSPAGAAPPAAAGATGRYRFRGLMDEAVLAALTQAARQLLHASVADVLRGRGGFEHAAAVRHLIQAGPLASVEDLARACRDAGRHSEDRGQLASAQAWYAKAARYEGDVLPGPRQDAAQSAHRTEQARSSTPAPPRRRGQERAGRPGLTASENGRPSADHNGGPRPPPVRERSEAAQPPCGSHGVRRPT